MVTTTQPALPGFDEHDEIASLRAAASAGPRAWQIGISQHLARPGPHGRCCLTCIAYGMAYDDLDWPTAAGEA